MLDVVSWSGLFLKGLPEYVVSLLCPFQDANISRGFGSSDDGHSVQNMSPIYVNNTHSLQSELFKYERRIRH